MFGKSLAAGIVGFVLLAGAIGVGTIGCIPPPPGSYATIHVDAPLPPPPPLPGVRLPPPPPIVLPPVPRVVYAPTYRVDYVQGIDYDVFYVNNVFYTCHSGVWYCTHRPGAAWVAVNVSVVPQALRKAPPPPGWRPPRPGRMREVRRFRNSLPPEVARAARAPAASRPSAATPSSSGRVVRSEPPRARPAAPGRAPEGPPGRVKPSRGEVPRGTPPRASPSPPGRSESGPPGQSKQDKPRPGRARGRR